MARARGAENGMTGGRIVCIGGAVMARKYRSHRPLVRATSNPGEGFNSFGGVARNVAENLARLGASVGFISLVGKDDGGREITAHLRALGIDVSCMETSPVHRTAQYVAILSPDNELDIAIADMEIFAGIDVAMLDRCAGRLARADFILADCNLPAETLARLASGPRGKARLAVDTVSTPKSARLPADLSGIDLLFTNRDEASSMLRERGLDVPGEAAEMAQALRKCGAQAVVVSNGAAGVALSSADGDDIVPAVAADPVRDVTGAGDAMVAATLFGLSQGRSLAAAARMGVVAATLTIESPHSVNPALSPALVATKDRMTS